MPNGQATSAGRSTVNTIQAAVLDVAQNHANLSWYGVSNGSMPRGSDVKGFPWLVAMNAQEVGSGEGSTFRTGEIVRENTMSNLVWDIDVIGLWPYHPGDTKTWTTAQDAQKKLIQAFTIYWTAENTADFINIRNVVEGPIQVHTGHKFYRIGMTIRASEILLTDYT